MLTKDSVAVFGDGQRLLVSVRDAAEARAAVAGGADIIDIKDPAQGALGRASTPVIRDICTTLAADPLYAGPISAALGELHELPSLTEFRDGLSSLQWVKVGLSQLAHTEWHSRWQSLREQWHFPFLSPTSATPRPDAPPACIAVVYADWLHCAAPAPEDIVAFALESDTPGVLFDTYIKEGRTLLDHLSPKELQRWITDLHSAGKFVALAGRITAQQLPELVELHPDIIAVRSAVCAGGRMGRVMTENVAEFRKAMQQAAGLGTYR